MGLGINTKVLIQTDSLVYLFHGPVSPLHKQQKKKEEQESSLQKDFNKWWIMPQRYF